jgi:hypothetical protein
MRSKNIDKTDCRTQEGIVVGLIDALISICRILPSELNKLKKENHGELSEATVHALQDLTQDKDVLDVLRTVHSRHIISDYRADMFDKVIEDAKGKKI